MDWLHRSGKADVLAYAIMIVCLVISTPLAVRGGFLFGMANGDTIGAIVGMLIGAVGGVLAGLSLWLAISLMIIVVGVLFMWFVPRK
jgi:hypothetical protein